MKKIAVVSALCIDYSSSSILCLRNVLEGLSEDYSVRVYSPYPSSSSMYYVKGFHWKYNNTEVVYYGKRDDISEKRSFGVKEKPISSIKYYAYYAYKYFDLFGMAILNLRYVNEILSDLKNYNCDILLSASDPKVSHLMCNKIKKSIRTEFKYIQYWGDPLLEDISSTSHLPRIIKKLIEKKMLSCADKIVYVSPLTLERQKIIYKTLADRMRFVPTPTEIRVYEEQTNVANDYITIGYFGSYNTSVRNILPLYNAVKKMDRVRLIIVGDSDLHLKPTNNIKVYGRKPSREIEEYIRNCNIIIDLMNNRGGQIPAKIYRDAGTNKEILLITDGELSDLIKKYFEKYNRFTFVDNSEESIKSVLTEYLYNGIVKRKPITEFNKYQVAKEIIE